MDAVEQKGLDMQMLEVVEDAVGEERHSQTKDEVEAGIGE
jgi:hypothetical protein